jgi:pyruvate carboxylase
VVLRSAGVQPIEVRPGAALPPADFAAAAATLHAAIARRPTEEQVLSYLLYPQVFLAYADHCRQYENTSVIPTANFFYGLHPGEETAVEIEPGKTLIIRYLTSGDAREDGTRTVFFELNGQPREVTVVDRSVGRVAESHPKADPDNPNHIAAPMPGKISSVAVREGQAVRAGERLLSVEAMKMESSVASPRDATVATVLVKAGAAVEARDLLLVLEDQTGDSPD